MKKLQQQRGETFIESLAAVLLVTIILVGLTTAIASAARVNAKVRDADTSFQYTDSTSAPIEVIVKKGDSTWTETFQADGYTTKNGYHYYAYQQQEAGQ